MDGPDLYYLSKINLPMYLQENLILAQELEHAPAPATEFKIDAAPISETYKNGGNVVELAIPAVKVRIRLDLNSTKGLAKIKRTKYLFGMFLSGSCKKGLPILVHLKQMFNSFYFVKALDIFWGYISPNLK